MFRPVVIAWVMVGLFFAGSLGCGSRGQPADPAVARATLGRALDAWQKGDSLETFQGTSPAVTVVDRLWSQNVRLVQYEVLEEGRPVGFDMQFNVKLSLQDRGGRRY